MLPQGSDVGTKLIHVLSSIQILRIIQVTTADLLAFHPGIWYHLDPHVGFPGHLEPKVVKKAMKSFMFPKIEN